MFECLYMEGISIPYQWNFSIGSCSHMPFWRLPSQTYGLVFKQVLGKKLIWGKVEKIGRLPLCKKKIPLSFYKYILSVEITFIVYENIFIDPLKLMIQNFKTLKLSTVKWASNLVGKPILKVWSLEGISCVHMYSEKDCVPQI